MNVLSERRRTCLHSECLASRGLLISKVSGQGPKRGCFWAKSPFNSRRSACNSSRLDSTSSGNTSSSHSHAFGQNGGFAIGADREFQRTVGDDATHVEIAPVGHVGHVQQVSHQSAKSDGPLDFSRLDGGHDADVVSSNLPRPRANEGMARTLGCLSINA